MFEAISVGVQNKSDAQNPIDIGSLVECMLFYKRVVVISPRATLRQLIKHFGVDRLLILIDEGFLEIVYTESGVAIHTTTEGVSQFHDAIEYSSPQHSYEDELRRICVEIAGKPGRGRRDARKIQDKLRVTRHDHMILEGARRAILDEEYVSSAAKIVLEELLPGLDVSHVTFHAESTDRGIVVHTNIDFDALNALYHRSVSAEHSSLSQAFILANLLTVEQDLFFASSHLAELLSSPVTATQRKLDYIAARSARSRDELHRFQTFTFPNAKSVRSAINSNCVDLDELIEVLRRSQKFKEWIQGLSPDADLIKKYYEEVTRESVLERLPSKTARWSIFTGLGFAADVVAAGGLGTAVGVGVSALDALFLDKMLRGWKPSQFIEDVATLVAAT